jgi:uncharacterized protein (TIGR02246 family)
MALRTRSLLVGLTLAAVTAACRPAAAAQDPTRTHPANPAVVPEIRALNDSMTATFARGDVAGVARFYADDGRLVGPRRQTVRGRAAIDRYWASIRGAKSWRLEVLEVGGTREAAYQVGVSTLVTVGADGQEHSSVTEFVVIWKRQADGSLKIALDLYV